jgi:integrase
MPIQLIDPRPGKTPYYAGRGKHFSVYVDRSTKARSRKDALKILRKWERDIERGAFAPAEPAASSAPTFASAALSYMRAGGDRRYLTPLLQHLKETSLDSVDQSTLDEAAASLMPDASAPTRNRQIYTPAIAVLHHAGVTRRFKRPKGWRGTQSTSWLQPDQAFAMYEVADKLDREFGLLLRVLTYTGMRISEALSVCLRDLSIGDAMIYLPRTKNSQPRAVHLPPVCIKALKTQPPRPERVGGRAQTSAGHPYLERPANERLFRFTRSGFLNALLKQTIKECDLSFPRRQGGFHLFCHTYGTWMHRYAELDSFGLARTDRWKDPRSADRYRHTAASEEARRSDWLPVPKNRRRA